MGAYAIIGESHPIPGIHLHYKHKRVVLGAFRSRLFTYAVMVVAFGFVLFSGPVYAQSCASPTGAAGDILYNNDYHVMQYCNGTMWKSIGVSPSPAGTLVGPTSCPNIGNLCADGTIYAGYHPVLKVRVFIPPTDQGGSTIKWRSSGSGADIATDSWIDGRANTDQVANSTTFPAIKACKDLTLGGYTDWYLPSVGEIEYLYQIQPILATGPFTNFAFGYYWSSTEYDNSSAYSQAFEPPNGQVNGSGKTANYRARCMRR